MDSVSSKSATVTCSAGKQATGAAGIKTHAAFGEVRLLAARPSSDLKSVVSTFREDETGFAGSWQPTAFALCAPLPGLQRVTRTTASNSVAKNVTASCPSGKRLVGLGGETNGGSGQVVIEVMRPDQPLTAAIVSAREDQNGFAGSWTVTAHAICAPGPHGLQRVSAAGQVTAGGPDVVADCPPGKGLLGVGGEASGQSGQVSLETYALPGTGEPTSGVARGFEDQDGYAPNWTLTAYAICANTAVRAEQTTSRDSSNPHTAGPLCPGAKRETGAGAEITGGLGQVVLEDLAYDLPPPHAVHATAWEDQDGYAGLWSLTGYSICASPLPGLELVTRDSAFDSATQKSASVSCPTGKRVVGTGGAIHDGSLFDGAAGQVVLDDVKPNAALTSVTAAGEEDQDLYPDNWFVRAFAVCANPPPGLQLVSRTSQTDSNEIKQVSATCPVGKHLLGTGAEITAGFGQAVLDDVQPDAALKNVTVTGIEDQDGSLVTWTLFAHAICANH
jgi:hypothetical protein